MNRTLKIYVIIFVGVLALLILFQLGKKEVIDWRKNYDVDSKSPFGLYIFNKEIDSIFKGKLIRENKSAYEFYTKNKNIKPHNILIINQNIPNTTWNKILEQVENGSDLFYIAETSDSYTPDTLSLRSTHVRYEKEALLKFTDPKLVHKRLFLDRYPTEFGYSRLLPEQKVLGSTISESIYGVHFIKQKYGNGNIYLHTEPLFITNYYLLKSEGPIYASAVFSYLPNRSTRWFTDTKVTQQNKGIFSFILQNKSLKYAWYTFIFGLLVFIIFYAKRKQRIVPIISPLENKSLEFVKSISNLYLQEGNVKDMMNKKSQYFLHKIRMDYRLDTSKLNDEFISKLQLITGKPKNKLEQIVKLILLAQDNNSNTTKHDLIILNELIDNF